MGEPLLGRYHCVESVRRGPLGETFRARVFGIGGFEKEFAITHLASDESGFLRRLARAATAAAQLQHEGIARVLELESDGARCFLVAELARGATCADLLRAGPLPIAAALSIALDVCGAPASAHGRADVHPNGVVHLGRAPPSGIVGETGA